ncbi:IS21 family transposase [Fundicoccus sp. Sow4_F4]|uniref:IS21 family transposase n=1 Tax=Fundicoccus sp. Sow4_F4 TaxID=3438783 RepID=UPI003F910842
MKQYEIINLYRDGVSFRKIAQRLDVDRKTVSKICHRYQEGLEAVIHSQSEKELEEATHQVVSSHQYNTKNRTTRTFTPEVDQLMRDIYQQEKIKNRRLGSHKQALTAKAVHELITDAGHSIGYRTVAHYWSKLKEKTREAYIRQEYPLGHRVEFDFGEVKLEVAGKVGTYYLAVLACPASGFHWAYLYTNQKQAVFQEAHVQFFELVGGVYREVVYDNMRNVVTRFIGKNEKELNESLLKLSLYYGFDINVTNCFSGNEKGTVEGRVKSVRRAIFSKVYQFQNLEAARDYLSQGLIQLNQTSQIKVERGSLLAYRPPYEVATVHQCRVNKYSTIQFKTNHYSVPDYLVQHQVQVKEYAEYLLIYANHEEVCRHQKIEGSHQYQLDIYHYLKTLMKKPGALKHSKALKNNPDLETLYYQHYKGNAKFFIEQLSKFKQLSHQELLKQLKRASLKQPITNGFERNQVILEVESNLQRLNKLYGLEVTSC